MSKSLAGVPHASQKVGMIVWGASPTFPFFRQRGTVIEIEVLTHWDIVWVQWDGYSNLEPCAWLELSARKLEGE